MKCLNCGKEIEDDAKFCPYCKEEVIKVEIIEQEPKPQNEEIKEEENVTKSETVIEPEKVVETEKAIEPDKVVEVNSNQESNTVTDEEKKMIADYESKMSIVTIAVVILTFGAPTITFGFYMSSIQNILTYVMIGIYLILMVANAYIDHKCGEKSQMINRRFLVNIVLTLLACVIYMFFIHLCDGCFSITCIG